MPSPAHSLSHPLVTTHRKNKTMYKWCLTFRQQLKSSGETAVVTLKKRKRKNWVLHFWFWLFDDKWWIGLTCVQVFWCQTIKVDEKFSTAASTFIFITKFNKCTDILYKMIFYNSHSWRSIFTVCHLALTRSTPLELQPWQNGIQLHSIKSGSLCSLFLYVHFSLSLHIPTGHWMSFHFFRLRPLGLFFVNVWKCQKQAQHNDCMQIRNSLFETVSNFCVWCHLFYAFISIGQHGSFFGHFISIELEFNLILIDSHWAFVHRSSSFAVPKCFTLNFFHSGFLFWEIEIQILTI